MGGTWTRAFRQTAVGPGGPGARVGPPGLVPPFGSGGSALFHVAAFHLDLEGTCLLSCAGLCHRVLPNCIGVAAAAVTPPAPGIAAYAMFATAPTRSPSPNTAATPQWF